MRSREESVCTQHKTMANLTHSHSLWLWRIWLAELEDFLIRSKTCLLAYTYTEREKH